MTNKTSPLRLGALCAALALTQGLSGCAPLVVGGAMAATTMMACVALAAKSFWRKASLR